MATLNDLEKAIRIAVEAHSGQTDKASAPYILHPLRVMLSCDTDDEKIAAFCTTLSKIQRPPPQTFWPKDFPLTLSKQSIPSQGEKERNTRILSKE